MVEDTRLSFIDETITPGHSLASFHDRLVILKNGQQILDYHSLIPSPSWENTSALPDSPEFPFKLYEAPIFNEKVSSIACGQKHITVALSCGTVVNWFSSTLGSQAETVRRWSLVIDSRVLDLYSRNRGIALKNIASFQTSGTELENTQFTVVEPQLETLEMSRTVLQVPVRHVEASKESSFCFAEVCGIEIVLGFGGNSAGELPILKISITEAVDKTFSIDEENRVVKSPTLLAPPNFVSKASLSYWKSISCGWHHIAGIDNEGYLHTWGLNLNGQIGNGTLSVSERVPVRQEFFAPSIMPIKAVSCGCWNTLVLSEFDQIFECGSQPRESADLEHETHRFSFIPQFLTVFDDGLSYFISEDGTKDCSQESLISSTDEETEQAPLAAKQEMVAFTRTETWNIVFESEKPICQIFAGSRMSGLLLRQDEALPCYRIHSWGSNSRTIEFQANTSPRFIRCHSGVCSLYVTTS